MPEEQSNTKISSPLGTVAFMATLSLIAALILSVIASALQEPKEIAKDLDRSKQMLIAAKVLSHDGYFLVRDDKGEYIPAQFENGRLVKGSAENLATKADIIKIYESRLIPLLVDKEGNLKTFQEAKIDLDGYVSKYRSIGYYKLPLMLIYKLLPNPQEGEKQDPMKNEAIGWVIPVNGFGLWDAIYGYLALKPDGDTVIGITWYDQKETPGLGANIAEPYWQNQFYDKKIFTPGSSGQTDFKSAPLGITVVKGLVAEVYGDSPRAKSAVDGMAGATLTGNGVTQGYKDVLAPYRPFFIKLHDSDTKNGAENSGSDKTHEQTTQS
ncbi:NADH:ubiquinone reductase (Na(+)-transporting) subunit C [Estrella lausannensis]|uniref:Na(+)-translocating NADH-quinone reductase subunit C n=1 Tax=Estrella lausannensis TaxID=483423 RepID=A0A0H5DP72_9BACT|nr:NADH:ubiquinone reductase (Na(+)-transporting) subunit C [Estrella lausannensis]CRX37723.1 putative Na(+)-translocating NADH-quinone reductase subunit C [Estrella lausannensis]